MEGSTFSCVVVGLKCVSVCASGCVDRLGIGWHIVFLCLLRKQSVLGCDTQNSNR